MKDLVKDAQAGDRFVFHCEFVQGTPAVFDGLLLPSQILGMDLRSQTPTGLSEMAWTKVKSLSLVIRSFMTPATNIVIWPSDIEVLDPSLGEGSEVNNFIIDDVSLSSTESCIYLN